MACFVELSSNKERSTLEQSVVKTLCQLFECDTFMVGLYDAKGDFNPKVTIKGDIKGEISGFESPLEIISERLPNALDYFLSQLNKQQPHEIYLQGEFVFWPLYLNEVCINVVVIKKQPDLVLEASLLNATSRIYSNFLSLLEASERDALTGLYNRRIFDTRLSTLAREVDKKSLPESERRHPHHEASNYLGIIDIDYFKRVNDDYGHLFGDEVLLWLAQNMRHCFRNEDSLFRYGGEEFAVLLTGLSQIEAQEAFERFRKTIATTDFPQIGQITVSIGYACIDNHVNPTLVFGDADKALYYAKEHGRNRVECYEDLINRGMLTKDISELSEVELF